MAKLPAEKHPFPSPCTPGTPPAQEEEKRGFSTVIQTSPESESDGGEEDAAGAAPCPPSPTLSPGPCPAWESRSLPSILASWRGCGRGKPHWGEARQRGSPPSCPQMCPQPQERSETRSPERCRGALCISALVGQVGACHRPWLLAVVDVLVQAHLRAGTPLCPPSPRPPRLVMRWVG